MYQIIIFVPLKEVISNSCNLTSSHHKFTNSSVKVQLRYTHHIYLLPYTVEHTSQNSGTSPLTQL